MSIVRLARIARREIPVVVTPRVQDAGRLASAAPSPLVRSSLPPVPFNPLQRAGRALTPPRLQGKRFFSAGGNDTIKVNLEKTLLTKDIVSVVKSFGSILSTSELENVALAKEVINHSQKVSAKLKSFKKGMLCFLSAALVAVLLLQVVLACEKGDKKAMRTELATAKSNLCDAKAELQKRKQANIVLKKRVAVLEAMVDT